MTQYEVVIGTVGILLASNLFGVLYSFVVLRSNLFSRFRIQKKKYKEGVFGARFGLYFFNLVLKPKETGTLTRTSSSNRLKRLPLQSHK